MAGKAIGKTMPLGYRGNVSRTPDIVIESFRNVGTANIEYGSPVYFAADGVKAIDASATAAKVIGIAVRHMGQPYSDSNDGWHYAANDSVDVLVRGSVIVELGDTSTPTAHGQVYVTNAGVITATASNNLAIPHAIFSTGKVEAVDDSHKLVEVTILERSI